MTEEQAIAQTAEKYRSEGFAVTLHPDPAALPEELRNRKPEILAIRNGTSVVVEFWSRDRLNEPPPAFLPRGWEFDVVVFPRTPGVEGGPPATPEFTKRLLAELEELLPMAARQARFLIAWSAVESAMRVAAQRVGIDAARLPPRQLMTELVSAGILSRDHFDRLCGYMADRNRLAHGVPGDTADPRAVDEMAVLARDLISEKLATAG